MSWLRRCLGRLDALLIVAWLFLGACGGAPAPVVTDFALIAACHEAASKAADCHAAEEVIKTDPSCVAAFPGGATICKDGGR